MAAVVALDSAYFSTVANSGLMVIAGGGNPQVISFVWSMGLIAPALKINPDPLPPKTYGYAS